MGTASMMMMKKVWKQFIALISKRDSEKRDKKIAIIVDLCSNFFSILSSFLIEIFHLICRTIFFWWPNDDSSSFLNLKKRKEIIDYCLTIASPPIIPLLPIIYYCGAYAQFSSLSSECSDDDDEEEEQSSFFFENYHTKLIIYLKSKRGRGNNTQKNIIL